MESIKAFFAVGNPFFAMPSVDKGDFNGESFTYKKTGC